MSTYQYTPGNRVFVLLAPGFEEGPAIYCLDRMREKGLPVSLVSLSAGLVNGLHGVAVRPDYTLDQLLPGTPCRLVIVPGGRQCVASLIADPRVHQLFDATLENEGFLAAMDSAEPLLAQIGISTTIFPSRFVSQQNMGVDEFSTRLIDLASR